MLLQEIQHQFKQSKEQFNEDFRLRIHRSLSWLQQAEQAQQAQDFDSQFIFLWIAFNAAYAKDLGAGIRSVDKGLFVQFIYRICHLDQQHHIYDSVWNTFSGSIRIILNNKFTFQQFWDYHNGLITETEWLESFERNKQKALNALSQKIRLKFWSLFLITSILCVTRLFTVVRHSTVLSIVVNLKMPAPFCLQLSLKCYRSC